MNCITLQNHLQVSVVLIIISARLARSRRVRICLVNFPTYRASSATHARTSLHPKPTPTTMAATATACPAPPPPRSLYRGVALAAPGRRRAGYGASSSAARRWPGCRRRWAAHRIRTVSCAYSPRGGKGSVPPRWLMMIHPPPPPPEANRLLVPKISAAFRVSCSNCPCPLWCVVWLTN